MKELFLQVVNLSLIGTYSGGIVYLVRLCLKRAPKWISYRMWLVVLFRLLCPVSISSVISLLKPIGQSIPLYTRLGDGFSSFAVSLPVASSPLETGQEAAAAYATAVQEAGETVSKNVQTIGAAGSAGIRIPWDVIVETILPWLWILGVTALLLYGALATWRVRKQIQTAVRLAGNCYETDQIETPFVFGLFRPRIYLPVGTKESERQYILLHEQIHIRRYDPLVKWIGFLTLAIHWFNPAVWGIFFLFSKDMELSCDEQVLREMGAEEKVEYGSLLLQSAVQQSAFIHPLSFGKGYIKERIQIVMRYKKATWWTTGLAVLLAVFILTACAVNPTEKIQPNIDPLTVETTTQSKLAKRLYERKLEHGNDAPQQVETLAEYLPVLDGSKLREVSVQAVDGVIQGVDGVNSIVLFYDSLDDETEVTHEEMFPIAVLLFAVVDDVDQVTFAGFWSQPERSSFRFEETISRETADQKLGCDVRIYGASPEKLETLIQILEQEAPLWQYESKDLETAVALAALQRGSGYYYYGGECGSEGHVILGTKEDKDVTMVYAIATVSQYGFQNGIFTPVSGSGAIPTVLTLVKNQEGEYACVKWEQPMDGAYYISSLEELFPQSLWSKVKHADQYYEGLVGQKEAYAEAYLKQIGREAKIQEHVETILPDLPVEVSNLLLELRWEYPYWIGTEERIEDGVRYIYETKQEKTGDGPGIMVYEKRTEDGTLMQSMKVNGENGSVISINTYPTPENT